MNNSESDVVIKYAVAGSVIVSFLSVVWSIIFLPIPKEKEILFAHLVGMVEGAFVSGLVAYYYTRGSKDRPLKLDQQVGDVYSDSRSPQSPPPPPSGSESSEEPSQS